MVKLTGAHQQGGLLLALGLLALLAAFLPIVAKGAGGITVWYLSGYTDFSRLAALPLGLFGVAAATMLSAGLLISGYSRAQQRSFLGCGAAGLVLSVLGVNEGIEHIIAFSNACSALQMSPADSNAPITVGSGGMLAVGAYCSMTVLGVFPARLDPP